MADNILDCDTYDCPLYDGAHGCKKKIVQLSHGVCREYLSQLRLNRIEANIEKLIKYIQAPESNTEKEKVKEGKLEATAGSAN